MNKVKEIQKQVANIETITSLEVAEMVGKRHDNLMRDIKNYIEVLTTSNLRALEFFVEGTYLDGKGEQRNCFNVTRKGCEMIAHKLTGEKGILFTAKYIEKFHMMAENIQQKQVIQLSVKEQLKLQYEYSLEIDNKVEEIQTEVADLKENMPLFNTDCKELQSLVRKKGVEVLGGYNTVAYRNNSLRGKIYADIQRQLKREFGVSRYESIKRSQLDIAKSIIEEYKAPTVLNSEINLFNSQESLL